MKFRKQYTQVIGSDTSLKRDIVPNDGKDGCDSRIRLARAKLSESISFRSGFSPRRIFSTTFPGIGGSAGERMSGGDFGG